MDWELWREVRVEKKGTGRKQDVEKTI